MTAMLSAPVPRCLRVRASIQISTTRIPARAFLIGAGLIFMGGLAVVGGADLVGTTKVTAALITLSLVVFELHIWQRSTPEVAAILLRHLRRSRRLRLEVLTQTLSAETGPPPIARRPRWQRGDGQL